MLIHEIRSTWLDYFKRNEHEIVPSASLISPDPTLLFTVAGMVPFIPYIMGTQTAPWPRAASVQKCIRTNDIENVGRTTRHGTFFQMGGSFSFGDYFKEGAIDLAWDLLTAPPAEGGFGLDGDRLWVTLWEQDSESFDVLTRKIGIDPGHIVRLPKEENFWDTGQPGPAGPCAEFHYDRGPEYGPEAEGGTVDPGGDRYLEVWNLVFDQFRRGEGPGKNYPLLGELTRKSIDTGLGVERLAYLLQGKQNLYETDEVFPVIARAEELTGRTYGAREEDDVRFRILADHVRSSLMLIGDGVRPGNEGRGYVLRRLVRRAVRAVRLLGLTDPALPELLPVSYDRMRISYPELETQWDAISESAYREEDAFRRTLVSGTAIFDQVAGAAKQEGRRTVSGDDAFKLHDTYGFPIDLTLEMAAEQDLAVDEGGFRSAMAEQKERARADAAAKKSGHADTGLYLRLLETRGDAVPFRGYTERVLPVSVETILVDGAIADTLAPGQTGELVLDETPFYAESGGQLADHGTIRLDGGAIFAVEDVQSPLKGLPVHRGRVVEGEIHAGERGVAEIDVERRTAIAEAHTATHLVHKALREELGDSASQAGSENSPGRLRFDFRFGEGLSTDAVSEIEGRVNERLMDNLEVTDQQMTLADARSSGAMALFGERYPDLVRVVSIGGDWSRELCGGTHVQQTGTLGRVNLLGESSIGSGVRRVEALVADSAYRFQAREHALVSQVSDILKTTPENVPERISALTQRLKEVEKEVTALRGAQLQAQAGRLAETAQRVGAVRLLAHDGGEGVGGGDLRTLAQDLRARLGEDEPAVVAVTGAESGKAAIVVATNAAARDRGLQAGRLLSAAAAAMNGKGGGKPDLAQGGGDPALRGEALASVRSAVGDA